MTDFQHISKEEREEWLRSTVTTAALSMLRELLAHTSEQLTDITESGSLDEIRYTRGVLRGVQRTIDQLTRVPK